MECKACQIDKSTLIYEDNVAVVTMPKECAAIGHVQIIPKQHAIRFEELPDPAAQHVMFLANYVASAVFEHLGAHGTNIIVHNGTNSSAKYPHVYVDVLPRKQEDGINFQWTPKSLSPEEMDEVAKRIRDNVDVAGQQPVLKAAPKTETKEPAAEKKETVIEGEENYLIRHLRRIP